MKGIFEDYLYKVSRRKIIIDTTSSLISVKNDIARVDSIIKIIKVKINYRF